MGQPGGEGQKGYVSLRELGYSTPEPTLEAPEPLPERSTRAARHFDDPSAMPTWWNATTDQNAGGLALLSLCYLSVHRFGKVGKRQQEPKRAGGEIGHSEINPVNIGQNHCFPWQL